jgi:hypothetical protein
MLSIFFHSILACRFCGIAHSNVEGRNALFSCRAGYLGLTSPDELSSVV